MHAAVLADLEVGEVEAECLHLPDEAVQLPICEPRSAGGAPARPGGCAGRRAAPPVRQTPWRDLRGASPRCARPRSGGTADTARRAPAPRWRARCPDDLSRERSWMRKRSSGGVVVGIRRKTDADSSCRGFEAAEDVLRLDEHRLAGDLRGDLRVAVTIATHPAAESAETPALDGGRVPPSDRRRAPPLSSR